LKSDVRMSTNPRTGYVFISYKREEALIAKRVREALIEEGFNVWWDEDLQCGQAWAEKLDEAVMDAACIIVLWSKLSVGSQWVRHEASQAIARQVYAPCRIELVQLDSPYDRIQATDLINWDGDRGHGGFLNLIERVNTLIPPQLSIPRLIGLWTIKNFATLVASGIAVSAMALLITIYAAQRADYLDKIYDCSTSPIIRGKLAIERFSRGESLSGVCLHRVDFLGVDLSQADLSRADISQADLSHADLNRTNLHRANLREAHLTSANLRGVILVRAKLMGAQLSGADLTEANLTKADLSQANLVRAKLIVAKLMGAQLSTADLREAILRGADFRNANLTGANLSGADLLEDVNFKDADLTGADFSKAIFMTAQQVSTACTDPNDPPKLPKGVGLPPPCKEFPEGAFLGTEVSDPD
jgi:uncharacterized protein YjbI with pentapeptide repeats